MARNPDPKTELGGTRPVTLARAFGFTRLIVELGVPSVFAFSLALFIAASVQAYETVRDAPGHLGDPHTITTLIIAVEQADTLLIGMALLIIPSGWQALFVGRAQNVPAWLHIDSLDDLKHKLIGIVVVALAVKFFSVALDWSQGSDILEYGAAIAAAILALGTFSVILSRQGAARNDGHEALASAAAATDAQS